MKKRRFSKRSTTEGFTLIEVLVVIVMIGILFAIAAPGWLAFINNQRVGTVRNEVFEKLKTAQTQAKQTKISRAIVFKNDADNSPLIAMVPVLNGTACPDLTKVGNWEKLGRGEVRNGFVQLTPPPAAPGAASSCIIFDSYGIIPDTSSVKIPYEIAIQAANSPGSKRCIIVETVLGAMRQVSKGENPSDPNECK